ncbi:diguanylate cyclase [Noviherbaspirillum aridicola]|uniref:diguanylate cyclase n=1 Tax=Noviherbaspirillum aridicola TaxID=2849687 RepID=A0ABQ4Q7Y5_9BURK|nr:diguanylate cyclase [Noviherbaspirillum aridicola]GIZ53106.1 diguanylate cyclase [Noviherbaspirillum aridicola]
MPEQDMDDIERTLREIREGWAAKLPQRLDEIRLALEACETAAERSACEPLRALLHTLSGSAGSFGFAELGMKATGLELMLNAYLAGETAGFQPIADGTRQMLDFAMRQLAPQQMPSPAPPQVSSPAPQQAPPQADTSPADPSPPASRLVYLVQDHADNEVATQLLHFGYDVRAVDDLSRLQGCIRAQPPAAVIIDLAFPEGIMRGADELVRIRREDGARCASVFISTRSNFSARLATVRAGADSYFAKPLDMVALVDRLDAMIQRDASPAYRVLVVDDDADIADFHAAVLRAAGMEVRVLYRAADVLDMLGDYRPELILMDVYMPDCDGTELARLIRQDDRHLDVPIVFLSSESDYGRQLEAIESGADDFLCKPIKPAHLVSALSSRARRYRALRSLIMRDSLTGLLNHSALKEQLARECARAARSGTPAALVMLDIDRFKQINDAYGHPVGDQVIRALARLLQQRLRRGDIIGRYGGEEFGVIMPGTGTAAAQKVIDGIRESFGKLRHHAEHEDFGASFSAGVSQTDAGNADPEALLRRADAALYEAKRQGRDRVILG